jgi:hypothetical protein
MQKLTKENLRSGKVPNEPGIYYLYDAQKQLIYVGSSNILLHRLQSYVEKDDFDAHPTKAGLRRAARYFRYQRMPIEEARELERQTKLKHDLKFNKHQEGGDPMPYANFHACRVKQPGSFTKIRTVIRTVKETGKKVYVLVGRLKGKTTTTAQSFRFPKGQWTATAAQAECKKQGGTFEAAAKAAAEATAAAFYPIASKDELAEILKDCSPELKTFLENTEEVDFDSLDLGDLEEFDFATFGEKGVKDIDGVEIFAVGTYEYDDGRGKTIKKSYSEKSLDKLVSNFKSLQGKVKPPLFLGHGKQHILERSGLNAAGWVKALRRDGKKLIADLTEVPIKVWEALKKGAYKRISSEIYPDYQGKGLVLRAVCALGADIPQVKTLDDILALYKATDDSESFWIFDEPIEGGESNMGKIELTQEELDAKLKAAGDEREKTLKTEHSEELKQEKDKREKAEKDLKAQRKKVRDERIKTFSEELKKERVAPVFYDKSLTQFCEHLDATEVHEFGEKDDEKKSRKRDDLGFFMETIEGIIKKAKDKKLFVPHKEHAPGQTEDEGSPGGEDDSAYAKAVVDRNKESGHFKSEKKE